MSTIEKISELLDDLAVTPRPAARRLRQGTSRKACAARIALLRRRARFGRVITAA
jgi:hypothetical protein